MVVRCYFWALDFFTPRSLCFKFLVLLNCKMVLHYFVAFWWSSIGTGCLCTLMVNYLCKYCLLQEFDIVIVFYSNIPGSKHKSMPYLKNEEKTLVYDALFDCFVNIMYKKRANTLDMLELLWWNGHFSYPFKNINLHSYVHIYRLQKSPVFAKNR